MTKRRMKRPPLREALPQPERLRDTPIQNEDEPSKVRKGRGPSKMRPAAVESERPALTVVGDMEFEAKLLDCGNVNQIKTTIRQIVLGRLDEPYLTDLHYPPNLMKSCLQEFLERYRWADQQDRDWCRQVFNNIAQDRFSDALTKARKNCKKKYGVDTDKWKDMPPNWCKSTNVWIRLCDKWHEEWQKISLQNSENRMSGDNVVHHVSGSAGGYRHSKKMEQKNGKKPSYEEVFFRTHVLPPDENGERQFVDMRSKQVMDSFNEMRIQRRGDDPSTYPLNVDQEDIDLWLLASGGYSHGRFYGVPPLINNGTIPVELHKRQRISRKTALAPVSPSAGPTSGEKDFYTAAEVRELLEQQERRHQEQDSRNKVLFDAIFAQIGVNPPIIPPPNGPESASSSATNG